MASLAFVNIWKQYGDVQALRGLDLDIPDGELLAVVGPSGCGKSTALRAAAGLEQVTSGSILIGDRDVTGIPAGKRNISMVFQSYALFPHLTVEENIGFGLAARRVPKAEIRKRVHEAAEYLHCDALLDRRPYQLSGGERQRVALARALVRHPDVYLLDEPLSNLDAQLRVRMRAELKRIHQQIGATMVYVTHDQIEALTLGDRVAVLRDGVLQQVAPPDEIYERPANRFVASFIGSPAMNIFPASVEEGVLRSGPFCFDGAERVNGRRIEVGIRPEHLLVRSRRPRSAAGESAVVQMVELAGNETFLHLEACGHRVVVRAGPETRPEPGSSVWVEPSPGRHFVFDADSGQTIY